MTNVVTKKSKLEIELEQAKKRLNPAVEGSDIVASTLQPSNKRLKTDSSQGSSFMSDVVKRKSRLELEKEAAFQR